MNKEEKIDIGFDAVLENAILDTNTYYGNIHLAGNIFDDQRKRFDDGQRVITSQVINLSFVPLGIIAHTRNTRYLIIGDIENIHENKGFYDVKENVERNVDSYPSGYLDGVLDVLILHSLINVFTSSTNTSNEVSTDDSGSGIINTEVKGEPETFNGESFSSSSETSDDGIFGSIGGFVGSMFDSFGD